MASSTHRKCWFPNSPRVSGLPSFWYSRAIARPRCREVIAKRSAPHSSVARNMASTTMFFQLPPGSWKRSVSAARSGSGGGSTPGGSNPRTISSRALASGKGKSTRHLHPSHERLVDVLAQVRGEDHDPGVLLDPLQEVVDLHVRPAVLRILDRAALAEEGVGLIEEEDGVRILGLGEDPIEVLLGLAYPLAHHRREIDLEEIGPLVPGQQLRRHRLARAGAPGEENNAPLPEREPLLEARPGPGSGRAGALATASGAAVRGRQDQVVEAEGFTPFRSGSPAPSGAGPTGGGSPRGGGAGVGRDAPGARGAAARSRTPMRTCIRPGVSLEPVREGASAGSSRLGQVVVRWSRAADSSRRSEITRHGATRRRSE